MKNNQQFMYRNEEGQSKNYPEINKLKLLLSVKLKAR